MRYDRFQQILDNRVAIVIKTLGSKAEEYADDMDRLIQFKLAGNLLQCTPLEALMGMMVKHITSLATMIHEQNKHSIKRWEEKITDSIAYLILMEAVLKEEKRR